MIQHRDPYESTYRTNYSQAFSPRDEKPWKQLEPSNAGPPTKAFSRRSNISHRSNRSDNLDARLGSLPGIFPAPMELPPIFKTNESQNFQFSSKMIADKAAEIEQSVRADMRGGRDNRRVIEFYQNRASPSCAVVLLIARWLRLNIKFVDINLKNPNNVEELKKVNPMAQVPVIIDDGFTLTESRTIIKYLVCKFGSKHQVEVLYPSDDNRRAYIDALIDYEHSTLWPLTRSYLMTCMFDETQDRNYNLAQLQVHINEVMNVLSSTLTIRKFFGSDDCSLADVVLARDFALLKISGYFQQPGNCLDNLTDWMSRMESLPNWQESLEALSGLVLSHAANKQGQQ